MELTILALVLGSAVTATPAVALEKIVDITMAPPGLLVIESPVSCLGDVFFSGYDDLIRNGLYAVTVEGVTVVADHTTSIPGSLDTFQQVAAANCAGDQLLFTGSADRNLGHSIFAFDGDAITPILEVGTPIGNTHLVGISFLDATSTGLVVSARLSPASVNQAIVVMPFDGTPFIIANRSTVLPGQTSPADFLAYPTFVGSDVIFHARTGLFTTGIYRWREGDGIHLVVDSDTLVPIPGQGEFFQFSISADLNGRLVFPALYSGGQGIFAYQDGQVEPLILPGDVTGDGAVLRSAERPIGKGDLLGFIGRTGDNQFFNAVFVKKGERPVQRLLGTGDVVDGRPVAFVSHWADHQDVLIRADDGVRTTIYRARFPLPTTDVPVLSGYGVLVLAFALVLAGWWALRRSPGFTGT